MYQNNGNYIIKSSSKIISPRKLSNINKNPISQYHNSSQIKSITRVKSTYIPRSDVVTINVEKQNFYDEYTPSTLLNRNSTQNRIQKSSILIQSPQKGVKVYRHSKINSIVVDSNQQKNRQPYNHNSNVRIIANDSQRYVNSPQKSQKFSSSSKRLQLPSLFTTPDDIYQGQFNQKGEYEGFGIYHFKGCDILYQGQFSQGYIHGQGKLQYQGISNSHLYPIIYVGNFKYAKKYGKGKYFYGSQNHYYDGQWVNDFKEGQGKYQSPEQQYSGSWAKNKKHGEGIFWNKNNNTQFRGSFYDDHFINGSINYSNGDSYHGGFHLGKKQGQGVYIYYSKNQKYEGSFSNDLRHGKGAIKYSNGDELSGVFRHGRLDESMNCSYKWQDGSVFNGWFKNNKPDKGTIRNIQEDKQYQYTSAGSFLIY